MKDHPRDFKRLLVLIAHFSHGKKALELSSARLAHLLSIPEVRVLELLTMLADEDCISITGLSETSILKKETKQELKELASPYAQRCRIRHADIGVPWGFETEDYCIYDIAATYRKERIRRTTMPYLVFSGKKDPRRQPSWSIFRRAFAQIKEFSWNTDQYIIAQIEETSWCKAHIFPPISWIGSEKAKERMFNWLEKSKMETVHTKKDSAYELSKHLVDSIMRARKTSSVLDVLAIPGVIDQLSADYLQEMLKDVSK